MAFDYNSIKFLLWSKNLGVSFDRTLTLGHQGIGLSCSRGRLRRAVQQFGLSVTEEQMDVCYKRDPSLVVYADQFLRFLGAKEVISVDRSDFEGATLLHDLNQPFPDFLQESVDLVIDGGTLEHIYDYSGALANCLNLIRVGGHMITITPTSGQMGHGFYQFSPELFFRVFSKERGFEIRKIIAFDVSRINSSFYEIKDPAISQQRTDYVGKKPMQLAVLAQRIAKPTANLEPPQQSDYVALWESHQKQHKSAGMAKAGNQGFLARLRVALNPYWPIWLRDFRGTWLFRIRWQISKFKSSLANRRHFRRLSDEDIFRERGRAIESSPKDASVK